MMLDKVKLSQIYLRDKKEYYLDPIRKRLVMVTPEETIRQEVIRFLLEKIEVPYNMLRVEEALAHYGVKTRLRADIIIEYFDKHDNVLRPISIIETKAPNVVLGEREHDQVMRYADMLGCNYIMLTNGEDMRTFHYSDNKNAYLPIAKMPKYEDMLDGKYQLLPEVDEYRRCPYEHLSKLVLELQEEWTFAPGTARGKLVSLANFYSCLMDTSHRMPAKNYGIFHLVEDYGVRILTYGNASGNSYSNSYRSFLIDVDGNAQFVSIGINAYSDNRTIICVAIDDDKSSHHALQLAVDSYMTIDNNKCCTFTHSGRIAVGHSGSGKASDLFNYVEYRLPSIIYGKKYLLGKLIDVKPWYMDDNDMIDFIANLISYGLVRDEYRNFVKS